MRHLGLALGLILALLTPAAAYQAEAERSFGSGARPLAVIGTTDIDAFAPVLDAFAEANPDLTLRYVQASANEVYRAIADEGAPFDVVLSSAMDLQMRLANDGLARPLTLEAPGLPPWAQWRHVLFGLSLDPVATLIAPAALDGAPPPRTRRELVALMRERPQVFDGRIVTYDPQVSGVGYFLIAQDERMSEGIWRLVEVMGRLNARQVCCAGDMVAALRDGRAVLAYNVVASYADRPEAPGAPIRLDFQDYTLALQRTALVSVRAPDPQAGARLMGFLLSPPAQRMMAERAGVALIPGTGPAPPPHLRPVRLDTGLIVYGDRVRRAGLIAEWAAAMTQP